MVTRVVGDSWYVGEIEQWTPLDDVVPARWRRAVSRFGLARGVALAWAARRRGDVVVTTNPSPGVATAIVLLGLLGRRRLVLLEYIVDPPEWNRPVRRVYFLLLRRVLLRRALLWAHVLTRREVTANATAHHLPEDRFVFVPWPGRLDDEPVGAVRSGRRVVASGRRTDWPTFFSAAQGADWDIHVVCGGDARDEVERLAAGLDVVVRSEIPAEAHQQEVDEATVYVLSLEETGGSNGQIRVMNAAQAGAALVASAVQGIEDYVDDSCAVMVPPGDAGALRRAVDALLDDPERRTRLRDALRSRGVTMAGYLDQISDHVAAL